MIEKNPRAEDACPCQELPREMEERQAGPENKTSLKEVGEII